MTKRYKLFNDPGHGWLEVDRSELVNLGIIDKVTRYSYQSRDGSKVYLEEDCDLSIFCRARENAGKPIGRLDIEDVYHEDDRIRGLPGFNNKFEALQTA